MATFPTVSVHLIGSFCSNMHTMQHSMHIVLGRIQGPGSVLAELPGYCLHHRRLVLLLLHQMATQLHCLAEAAQVFQVYYMELGLVTEIPVSDGTNLLLLVPNPWIFGAVVVPQAQEIHVGRFQILSKRGTDDSTWPIASVARMCSIHLQHGTWQVLLHLHCLTIGMQVWHLAHVPLREIL